MFGEQKINLGPTYNPKYLVPPDVKFVYAVMKSRASGFPNNEPETVLTLDSRLSYEVANVANGLHRHAIMYGDVPTPNEFHDTLRFTADHHMTAYPDTRISDAEVLIQKWSTAFATWYYAMLRYAWEMKHRGSDQIKYPNPPRWQDIPGGYTPPEVVIVGPRIGLAPEL